MDRTNELSLNEQLMLLMLRDDTGTMEWHTSMYQLALGGSILAELLLAGAISIEDDKTKTVRVVRAKGLHDPILDEALKLVSTSKRPHGSATWVSQFGGIKGLRHRIAENLCRKGILDESEDKVLFFFTRKIYPTIRPETERRIVERMRDAVLGSSRDLEPATILLISLAHATGLLPIHFESRELKDRKQRIEEIANGGIAGTATAEAADAIRAAQQAAQTAMMTAIIASTVINTTIHS